jgi:hypothetical protein
MGVGLMTNNKMTLLFVIAMLAVAGLIVSCESSEKTRMDKAMRMILKPFRSGQVFKDKNDKLANELYNAVYRKDIKAVKKVLERGADPNYCLGEAGWIDSNPLNVIAESFYDVYYRKRIEKIADPIPDVAVLNILLEAGSDINRRPYIWDRVFLYDNVRIEGIRRQREVNNESTEPEAMQEQIDVFISDANRLIEAFLKAGADPDKLGHPYPFSYEAVKARIADEQANEYFARGTRAVNEAIEKGIAWESQVDLLLQYTKLDEKSLKAAERSNDPAMIEKINRLWEMQQEKH